MIYLSILFGTVSVLFAMASAILFLIGCDYSGAVGVFSTIISTVLSVVSILYTYISGNKTIKLMDDITRQHKTLVGKVQSDLVKDNFDEENIENLRNSMNNELIGN